VISFFSFCSSFSSCSLLLPSGYLNSVLQCFIYTTPLQSYLLTREHSASCEYRSLSPASLSPSFFYFLIFSLSFSKGKFLKKKEFCSLCSIEEVVFSLLSRDQNNDYFPRTLLENLGKIFMDFAGFGRQEDAHEFALGLLNVMQSEIGVYVSTPSPSQT
jgi:ubiquitin C-terminal hydrolase